MIFVTVGSQKFQFNRLLIELDRLKENKEIEDDIFAQVGSSDYIPQNYSYKDFVDRDEFQGIMNKCDIVISHGGTGAIITALKSRKKVIGVPRLSEYGEHVDDHQMQLVKEFEDSNLIKVVYEINTLGNCIKEIKNETFNHYESNTMNIINDIEYFILKSV